MNGIHYFQAILNKNYCIASDVFGLGATLYHLVMLFKPWQHLNADGDSLKGAIAKEVCHHK